MDLIEHLADGGLVLSRDARRSAIRLYNAAQAWTNQSANQGTNPVDASAREIMIIECLIPLAISSGQGATLCEVLRSEHALSEQVRVALEEAVAALAWPPELISGQSS